MPGPAEHETTYGPDGRLVALHVIVLPVLAVGAVTFCAIVGSLWYSLLWRTAYRVVIREAQIEFKGLRREWRLAAHDVSSVESQFTGGQYAKVRFTGGSLELMCPAEVEEFIGHMRRLNPEIEISGPWGRKGLLRRLLR